MNTQQNKVLDGLSLVKKKKTNAHEIWEHVQTWKLPNNANSNNVMPLFFFACEEGKDLKEL